MQRVFIVISIVAACDYYRICSEVVKSDKLPDPDYELTQRHLIGYRLPLRRVGASLFF